MNEKISEKAKKATVLSFLINCILSITKLTVGILGKSGALLADGIHSFSDLVTDVIVFISIKITQKPADNSHNYGHGKVEIVATVMISIALSIAGFSIGKDGVMELIDFAKGVPQESPAGMVLIVAAASFIIKEILFRYTISVGKSMGSEVLIANAMHQRSDAWSSLGVLLGAGGAFVLGSGFAYLDSIAQIIVSLFIFRAAYKILVPNIGQLVDAALDKKEIEEIEKILDNNLDIMGYHNMRTRKIGVMYAIDIHVLVEPELNISKAHDISTDIEYKIKERMDKKCLISIHIEPYKFKPVKKE